MTSTKAFYYEPSEHECEGASNSYLMSLIVIIVGLPIPIINLIATFLFFIANRKKTHFVRWHITQALLAQASFLVFNSYGFWWTISIIFTDESISNSWIAYIATIVLFNIVEFIATIYTAIETRKGNHVKWWLYGDLTDLFVKP